MKIMISEKIFPESFQHINQEITEAYHGTDYKSALVIKEKQEFRPSMDRNCYLGEGVYFFENSQMHAKEWAKEKKTESKKYGYGILQARVRLGRCLDLNNIEHKMSIRHMATKLKSSGLEINDALVLNTLANLHSIDTVRATYCQPKGKKLFEGSHFFIHTQQMICVRNKNKISSIELIEHGQCDK